MGFFGVPREKMDEIRSEMEAMESSMSALESKAEMDLQVAKDNAATHQAAAADNAKRVAVEAAARAKASLANELLSLILYGFVEPHCHANGGHRRRTLRTMPSN